MAIHNELGEKGEQLAIEYLKEKGFEILDINWRYEHLEIDIVAQKEKIVVFAEVKTRSSEKWGKPEESVHYKKRKRLVKAAEYYLIQKDLMTEMRFDIIAVVLSPSYHKIKHIEEAFIPGIDV
jgi:putative endonuclease